METTATTEIVTVTQTVTIIQILVIRIRRSPVIRLFPLPAKKDRITIYSKADWVAGEDLILFEDFSKDAVGDFPQLWNTNSVG